MKLALLPVTPFQQNSSLLVCTGSNRAALVDPGGEIGELIRSITGKRWPLGDDVRFVPGHGPMSTFGDERRDHPFVGDGALGAGRPDGPP